MDKSAIFAEKLGLVFQRLRNHKNFTQAETAMGVMSTAELSNFENGKAMPGADKVFRLLLNINVTLLEFQDAYNTYSVKDDILLYDAAVSNAYLVQDFGKLETILEEINSQIELAPDVLKFQLDKVKVEAIMKAVNSSFEIPENDISLLKNYLMKLKSWGLYDILLFGYCAPIFDVLTFSQLIDKMIKLTGENIHLHNVERALFQTSLSVIDACIAQNQYLMAEEVITFLENFKSNEFYTYEKLTLKYNKAKLGYLNGKMRIEAALATMEKCRETFLFCDCPNTANLIRHEIDALKKGNNT